MTTARRDGLYCLLFGILAFLTLAGAFGENSSSSIQDFKVLYYPARCLLLHGDPYDASAVTQIYQREDADPAPKAGNSLQIITRYIYLPISFFFTVPFALLPWGPAHLLWLALTAGSLIAASLLIWSIAAECAPLLSGILIGFLLGGGEVVLILCNAAGVAVAFCAIATWCFIRKRLVVLGIVCFAISLALKPHDSGLIWLYFLLAGGSFRKRALQTLMVMGCLSLPFLVLVWQVSPHWMAELHENLLAFSAPGGLADPTPALLGSRGGGVMINMQTAVSLLNNDPRFCNFVTYLICGIFLVVLAILVVRHGSADPWPAIASLSALSMLPMYHHLFDAKLLLLTVPACASVSSEHGRSRWIIVLINVFAIVATADLPWAVFLALTHNLHPTLTSPPGKLFLAAEILPAPVSLLAVTLLYVRVYASRSSRRVHP